MALLAAVDTQALLTAVRDKLADHYAAALADQLPTVADMLQVRADQASARDTKDFYRHAAETLPGMAETLRNGLAAAVRRRFDQRLAREKFNAGGTLTLDSLQLVDEAQMQEEIVLGKATIRLKEQAGFELFSLGRRIAHLKNIELLDDRDHPAFPDVFAHALSDALQHCGATPPQRLAIIEAFGPVLLEVLPQTYQIANDYLVGEGVLIEIKTPYGRVVHRQASPGARATDLPPLSSVAPAYGAMGMGAPIELATPAASRNDSELVSLLQQAMRRGEPGADGAPADESFYRTLSAATAGVTAHQTLDGLGMLRGGLRERVLSSLEEQRGKNAPAAAIATPAATDANGRANDVPTALDEAFVDTLDLPRLVTASVVLGAFNRLLASPAIRRHAGDLLLRMQLPVLKAAFEHPAILTDAEHPVRRAIDRLVEFAIAQPALMTPGTSTYESLSHVMDKLAANDTDDADAFAEAAERIDMFFAYHEESAAERDPKAVMLLEIDIWQGAINSANHAIDARLAPNDPDFIAAFARVIWREVLMSDMLNGGAHGDFWRRDIETLELLLQSVRPQTTLEARAELIRRLPALHSRLDEGAKSVNADPAYLANFTAALRDTQGAALSAALKRPAETAPPPATMTEKSADESTDKSPLATTLRLPGLQETAKFATMPHLVRGRWIEFIAEDGKRSRARLNWMSPVSAVCLFRDYLENDSFTIEFAELGKALEEKRARVVESLGVSRHAIDFAIRHLGLADT